MLLEVLVLRLEPVLLGLAASPLPAEKPSGSFVAEVVLSLLLAIVILALVATGSWYWLKQRVLASGQPAESNAPQGFDNITFRDVRTGVKGSCLPPTTPEQHVPKSSANPSSLPPELTLWQQVREVQRAWPLIWLPANERPGAVGLT